ncbi:MAG TPA: class I SAM-dependent methyltransferase [Candidatus Binatia bacterium]|jgi:ubiquinone/menaquinone biosynthesis C-methylase UbiE
MSKPSNPFQDHKKEHHHDQHHHHQHHHDHDPHDWHSSKYVSNWAAKQDPKEIEREEQFRLLAKTIPFDRELAIRILDVGAGYGALTQFLLQHFPNATAVCQDGSKEMMDLGRQRMEKLAGRFEYVLCDFSKAGWSRSLTGPFEAVVSSIAIHNVNSPNIIRGIYEEIFPLVKDRGCFLNYEILLYPLEDQLKWLKQAGFQEAKCVWQDQMLALFGGFKK